MHRFSRSNSTFVPVGTPLGRLPDKPLGIIVSSAMNEAELKTLKTKATHFDEIVEKYRTLQEDAGFYSKNWVELAEVIEAAMKTLDEVH